MDIVDTDAFLDMPVSSQALYFHLAMRADDDGFVGNPRKIMKICGAGEDDYRILALKRFLIPFDKGICVIKHWKIHNYLRKDTHKETKYTEEKATLIEKENGAYTESVNVPSTFRQRSVTQIREDKDSIDKVRLDKVRIVNKESYGEFKNVLLTVEEHNALCTALTEPIVQTLIAELDEYIESKGVKYKSHRATIQTWARRRINDHILKARSTKLKVI